MAPRAFISFQMEDLWARGFLVQQAHNKKNNIQFVDYSVQDAFDSKWKTNCKARIARTKGTIVLIGKTTYQSEAVVWEIAETKRQSHYMFGIQIYREHTYQVPSGLPRRNVIRWNFDQIVQWLSTWT